MELLNTTIGQSILAVLTLINLTALCVVGRDKRKAVRGHNAERAPEGFMFFLAAMFGAVGVYVGMLLFRHKTRKWYFQLGIPALIAQNAATAYVVWQLFHI